MRCIAGFVGSEILTGIVASGIADSDGLAADPAFQDEFANCTTFPALRSCEAG
jgi:hypothetical protein